MKALAALLTAALVCISVSSYADDVSKVNRSINIAAGETVDDVSTVNGSIRIEDGARAEDVETVNGSVRIGANAVVGGVESVNGRITLGAGARASAVETVNGGVSLGEGVQVSGAVGAVNGAIQLERNVQVAGDVENVNGRISLEEAQVGGGLKTTNGDILVGAGSRVRGGILVEKPNTRWFSRRNRPPEIVIGPNAVVEGELRFEHEVKLYVSETAQIGRIEGATPIKFSGAQPDRDATDEKVER